MTALLAVVALAGAAFAQPAPPASAALAAVALGRPLFYRGGASERDADHDGLEDGAEAALAEQFKPWLTFDDRENALLPGEPVTLYQARPMACSGPFDACGTHTVRVLLRYANLWQWDGGYGPESFFCGGRDSHLGDAQWVSVVARSDDDGQTFRAEAVDIGSRQWPANGGRVLWREGAHFELFLSAGKHHHYFGPEANGRPSPDSKYGCRDSVNGRGDSFMSVLKGNAGEPEAHLMGDLTELGFPLEDAWGTVHFCGAMDRDPSHCGASPLSQMWSKAPFRRP